MRFHWIQDREFPFHRFSFFEQFFLSAAAGMRTSLFTCRLLSPRSKLGLYLSAWLSLNSGASPRPPRNPCRAALLNGSLISGGLVRLRAWAHNTRVMRRILS